MRYSLHDINGVRIGEAATAQGIANIAFSGTFAHDTDRSGKWRWMAYTRGDKCLIGTPFEYRTDAVTFLRESKGV